MSVGVHIVQASDVTSPGDSSTTVPNLYCVVFVRDQRYFASGGKSDIFQRSSTCWGEYQPYWNERFHFSSGSTEDYALFITLWSESKLKGERDIYYGQLFLPLRDICEEQLSDPGNAYKWYSVTRKNHDGHFHPCARIYIGTDVQESVDDDTDSDEDEGSHEVGSETQMSTIASSAIRSGAFMYYAGRFSGWKKKHLVLSHNRITLLKKVGVSKHMIVFSLRGAFADVATEPPKGAPKNSIAIALSYDDKKVYLCPMPVEEKHGNKKKKEMSDEAIESISMDLCQQWITAIISAKAHTPLDASAVPHGFLSDHAAESRKEEAKEKADRVKRKGEPSVEERLLAHYWHCLHQMERKRTSIAADICLFLLYAIGIYYLVFIHLRGSLFLPSEPAD